MTRNWPDNYSISWHRCETMSILKINVLQVPFKENKEMHELGAKLLSTLLFILVYDDSLELLWKRWSAPVPRFHMIN